MVSNRYTTLHKCQFQLKLETHLRRNNVEKRRSPRLENSTLLKSEVRVVSWLIQISIHKICYFKNPGPTAHRPLIIIIVVVVGIIVRLVELNNMMSQTRGGTHRINDGSTAAIHNESNTWWYSQN